MCSIWSGGARGWSRRCRRRRRHHRRHLLCRHVFAFSGILFTIPFCFSPHTHTHTLTCIVCVSYPFSLFFLFLSEAFSGLPSVRGFPFEMRVGRRQFSLNDFHLFVPVVLCSDGPGESRPCFEDSPFIFCTQTKFV